MLQVYSHLVGIEQELTTDLRVSEVRFDSSPLQGIALEGVGPWQEYLAGGGVATQEVPLKLKLGLHEYSHLVGLEQELTRVRRVSEVRFAESPLQRVAFAGAVPRQENLPGGVGGQLQLVVLSEQVLQLAAGIFT